MPRSNRRSSNHVPLAMGRLAGIERRQPLRDGEFMVRHVRGAGAGKSYRCPGCQQLLPDTLPHVVVWPAHGVVGVEMRRHWHSRCWSVQVGRG